MYSVITSPVLSGAMAELVDALVLGTNFFGSEGSSPFRPTRKVSKNADKNDYESVNDMLVLSTKQKQDGVWLLQSRQGGRLRKNHTFHLNNTCANYSLSTRCFLNITSTTHLWWSCRRFTKTTRRHTPVLVSHKEMFSQCPQKHINPHYNNN